MDKINWTKYPNFSPSEFKCPCCGLVNIDERFLSKLQEAREIAGIPFNISSGCRCQEYNKKVGGKENSAHVASKDLVSYAVDIRITNDRERFLIDDALHAVRFHRFGIYPTWIHVDSSPSADNQVMWVG